MGEFLFHLLLNLFTGALALFQIGMLVDCVVNKVISRPAKVLWFIFMIGVPGIGPFLYAILGPSRLLFLIVDELPTMARLLARVLAPLRRQYQQAQGRLLREQPQPKAYDVSLGAYEQGYQAQNMPAQPGEAPEMEDYPSYEQPQASYPQQSQQQK